MSAEQTFSQADLRATQQDYKRDATRKHKWALGPTPGVGRAEGKPRPLRSAATAYNQKRREEKGAAIASLAHGAKVSRKHDMLEGAAITDDSSGASSSERDTPSPPPADVEITYSFDAARGPTKGSQILNAALAKAVETFQEKETVKLVKSEYELLDSDGETVKATHQKKGKKNKGKASTSISQEVAVVPDADEDYEFV